MKRIAILRSGKFEALQRIKDRQIEDKNIEYKW
jgi:hypothetical protein